MDGLIVDGISDLAGEVDGRGSCRAKNAAVSRPEKGALPFGKFDRGQLQRGFKVYREVCQTCHGLQLLAFRNLSEPGGPGFTLTLTGTNFVTNSAVYFNGV